MNTLSRLDRIRDLVVPSLTQCGVELVEAKWSGRGLVLQLIIDRPGGVNVDDCERVARTVTPLLDTLETAPRAYAVEVSSPGAERPLKSAMDWQGAIGRRVNVRYAEGDAETIVEGHLVSVNPERVVVAPLQRHGRRQLPSADIALSSVVAARIVVDI